VDTSAGSETQWPKAESSLAVWSQAAALRAEMYTRAPWARKPSAIMRPMPREPPVIKAVRPFSEKSWVVSMVRVSPELKELQETSLVRSTPAPRHLGASDRLRGLVKLRSSPVTGSWNATDLAKSCSGLSKSSVFSGSSTG
jgi:hypothetical protein